jgi:hypothetical protein
MIASPIITTAILDAADRTLSRHLISHGAGDPTLEPREVTKNPRHQTNRWWTDLAIYYLLPSINRKQALTQPYARTIRRQRTYILDPTLVALHSKLGTLQRTAPKKCCDHNGPRDDDLLAISGFRVRQ